MIAVCGQTAVLLRGLDAKIRSRILTQVGAAILTLIVAHGACLLTTPVVSIWDGVNRALNIRRTYRAAWAEYMLRWNGATVEPGFVFLIFVLHDRLRANIHQLLKAIPRYIIRSTQSRHDLKEQV